MNGGPEISDVLKNGKGLSSTWFATVCAEIIILSNLVHLEVMPADSKCDIVMTGKFPFPWLFSVFITTFLIAFSSRYTRIMQRSFGFLKISLRWIMIGFFFLTILALTFAALNFLDKDTYLNGNYKWALFAFGCAQLFTFPIEVIAFLSTNGEITSYMAQLFDNRQLEPYPIEWGVRAGIGIFMICVSFWYQTITPERIVLDILICLIFAFLFYRNLDASIRAYGASH